jgi:hypothetical protein
MPVTIWKRLSPVWGPSNPPEMTCTCLRHHWLGHIPGRGGMTSGTTPWWYCVRMLHYVNLVCPDVSYIWTITGTVVMVDRSDSFRSSYCAAWVQGDEMMDSLGQSHLEVTAPEL